jgi:transposase-like protein
MADASKSRRPRRPFTDEFKQQAVRLVLDEGKSVSAVARELDLVASALGNWVKQAQADRSNGRTGLTTAEREELVGLRKALRIAEEQRDILKNHGVLRVPASRGITCSMSRRGDCYDNAVVESFFATVKKEEAERFPSYSDAKMALFDYIEVFYNQRRRHSTLGQISPAAFEWRAAA